MISSAESSNRLTANRITAAPPSLQLRIQPAADFLGINFGVCRPGCQVTTDRLQSSKDRKPPDPLGVMLPVGKVCGGVPDQLGRCMHRSRDPIGHLQPSQLGKQQPRVPDRQAGFVDDPQGIEQPSAVRIREVLGVDRFGQLIQLEGSRIQAPIKPTSASWSAAGDAF